MQQPHCICFAPSIDARTHTLILGSMPGIRSLTLQQYYGHPQNRFWPLMTTLLGFPVVPDRYEQRLQMLLEKHIALWDVLAACERDGSLDAAITKERSNDFPALFRQYPHIKKVCFNGTKAFQSFKKHQSPLLAQPGITYFELPSTSPANAKWRLPMLEEVWSKALYGR